MSVAIIALAACLIKEQNLSSWTLHPSISVVSVLYSGLFGFPFSSGVHKWGLRVKGPVFVAIFRPTSIVIAVIMSAIFLGEAVYLGSVIGGVILTIGLYSVLWGKAKEEEMKDDGSGLSTKDPLLKSQNVEEN
ncbi:WAT1-related protein At5g40240 [Gossypium hirsutum]|nr:WAT1-related protein At5g40240-like [Gossypium hirsutum]